MNTASNSDKDRNQYPITCFICLDNYSMEKKPLILVCGHTFCESCLKNMFNQSNEIQCCFCKVVTKVDKFEDMIINYAILSLSDSGNSLGNFNNYLPTKLKLVHCEKTHFTPEKVPFLLQCLDCNMIICQSCNADHIVDNKILQKNHKVISLEDFISSETVNFSDFIQRYRELATKYSSVNKKIEKTEVEKIVKLQKEMISSFYNDLKSTIDKNQEMMFQCCDKLLKDALKSIDNFRKEIKTFNSDSQRFCSIIEELSSYKTFSNKQQLKLLNIYNINSLFEEIRQFNNEVTSKLEKLMTPESFMKHLLEKLQNCELYRSKSNNFHQLINQKLSNILEKGFESKIQFYENKKKVNSSN